MMSARTDEIEMMKNFFAAAASVFLAGNRADEKERRDSRIKPDTKKQESPGVARDFRLRAHARITAQEGKSRSLDIARDFAYGFPLRSRPHNDSGRKSRSLDVARDFVCGLPLPHARITAQLNKLFAIFLHKSDAF
jgi:hypothetical protein